MSNEQFQNYSFNLESNRVPVAIVLPAEQEAVVGSIVKLDGRSSIDPEGTGLTYTWSFTQVPIGSQVVRFGFSNLEDDSSIVTFAPDITGTYAVELVVSDGSLTSDPSIASIDTRIILVPHHQGFTPDASFIWNYLSDFWTKVDGRKKFEVFWSAAIQIVASEMLKLYQYDYNKSIRDIQEVLQRRWISYSPGLSLDRTKLKFILADDQAGITAATLALDPKSGVPLFPQPAYTSLVAVPLTEGAFQTTTFGKTVAAGRVLQLGQRSFTYARGNILSPSLNYGSDGESLSASGTFYGSQFTAGMVGATLRILAGEFAGDFEITAFVNATEVTVDATWASSLTDLSYSVIPVAPTHSAFFADQVQVPGGAENQAWRFSSTLISTEHHFEDQGVSPGDLLELEISRSDVTLNTTIYAQVVSVDRYRLGFVTNLDDLVDGVAASWFPDDLRATMAADLQVRGLAMATSGSLVYADEALLIKSLLGSAKFKRQYFETVLTSDSEIDLGVFKVKVRPIQIIRHKRIPVAEEVVSVPVLQEYIRQPEVIDNDGALSLVVDGGITPVTRHPYLLIENLDYVLDSEEQITGTCTLTAGSDEIQVPYGDLIDRSVEEQDGIVVFDGITDTEYEIRRVLSSDLLRVYPTPSVSLVSATFKISRRVSGKYLRFVGNVFTKKKVAPTRLWAEVTYFDNNEAVENNFGVLAGLTREQLEKSAAQVPYKSAVAGLMYALVNGPTISNLALSAQILLGQPFTQTAGVIKEINPDYRKRDDGSPLQGRILVEARDKNDEPIGLTNIYFYSQGRQIPDELNPGMWVPAVPEFSGLGINANTGVEFAVGDAVDQFVPLSKGIQIQEYLATPDWTTQLVAQGNFASVIQRYHAFQLVVNSDLVSSADIDLAAQFMRKAKPHYLKLTSALLKSLESNVDIEDSIIFTRPVAAYETPGLSLPSAFKFDPKDENESLLTLGGVFYTRYISGTDLVTTQGSLQVSSAAGGFVDARPLENESHDTPFLKAGDLLVIDVGFNSGRYVVSAVNSDTVVTVEAGQTFQTLSTQQFSVYRPIRNPIWYGKANITNGYDLVGLVETGGAPAAIGSAGVAVGDRLVFHASGVLSGLRYTVTDVVPDDVAPYIAITPAPTESSLQYTCWIIREPLLTKNLVAPYGTASPVTLALDFVSGTREVYWGASMLSDEQWLNACLIRPGDTLFRGTDYFTVIGTHLSAGRFSVAPIPSFTAADQSCYISRSSAPSVPVSFGILDRVPDESLELGLLLSSSVALDRLVTTAGLATVSTALNLDFADLGVSPGDYLLILEGTDSVVDIGHGPGVFPIYSVLTSQLRLLTTLNDTHAAPGILFGIRKKRPQ